MTGFEKGFISIRIHEQTGCHPEVIPEADNVNYIADRSTDLFKCCQVTFQ